MTLPEHFQPSSDRRIVTWLTAFTALTAGALWVRSRRAP
jgi:hypothetical protein